MKRAIFGRPRHYGMSGDESEEQKTMAYEGHDGHAVKRQRTDAEFGGQPGKRDIYEDPINPSPSPVIHVRGLPENTSEHELIDAVQNFGPVSYIMLLGRKRQALVEFEDISGAMALIQYAESNPLYVAGKQAHFNYSTSQKIQRPGGGEDKPNNVLLFTILNPKYPINVDVMHTICSGSGTVNRIVIFKKNGVQAMVEMETVEAAMRVKQSLNGADVYSGCCTLRIEFAKPTRLNVFRNDQDSWDYTNPNLGKEPQAPPTRQQPLLAEPRYGAAPVPYGHNDGGRRNQPSVSAMDYSQQEPYDPYPRPTERYPPPPQQQDRYGHDPYGQNQAPPPQGPSSRYDPYGQHNGPPPPHQGGYHNQSQAPPGPPNGPTMYQQGAVLMVYGLNPEKMNATKLFNLFCLYGNVVRVKFLKSKEGVAMIQLGDAASCDRAMKNLNNNFFFGSKMQLGFSKQAFLQDVPNPHELPDESKSFLDFMGNRNNRFTNPDAAAKNRIQPPSKCLYFFNAPPAITEEQLQELFVEHGAKAPAKMKRFPGKSEKSSTGLLEWESKGEAIEAMVCANHCEIPNPTGKYPYIFKLCFSSSPIMG